MAEDLNSRMEGAPSPTIGKRSTGTDHTALFKASADDFPGDFARLKLTVIRPAFEATGEILKERGHEINISEEPGGKISIHIVPAGVGKSIHPYKWFPTLSIFGAPFTKTIGLHGINARRNADGGTGERGNYKLSEVSKAIVEKELMKFVGEIANW